MESVRIDNPFRCEPCFKSFSLEVFLKYHNEIYHSEEDEEEEDVVSSIQQSAAAATTPPPSPPTDILTETIEPEPEAVAPPLSCPECDLKFLSSVFQLEHFRLLKQLGGHIVFNRVTNKYDVVKKKVEHQ